MSDRQEIPKGAGANIEEDSSMEGQRFPFGLYVQERVQGYSKGQYLSS